MARAVGCVLHSSWPGNEAAATSVLLSWGFISAGIVCDNDDDSVTSHHTLPPHVVHPTSTAFCPGSVQYKMNIISHNIVILVIELFYQKI